MNIKYPKNEEVHTMINTDTIRLHVMVLIHQCMRRYGMTCTNNNFLHGKLTLDITMESRIIFLKTRYITNSLEMHANLISHMNHVVRQQHFRIN